MIQWLARKTRPAKVTSRSLTNLKPTDRQMPFDGAFAVAGNACTRPQRSWSRASSSGVLHGHRVLHRAVCEDPVGVAHVNIREHRERNSGDRPGAGRRRRITEAQRSAIIALARSAPPGQLARDADGELSADDERGPAQWTLDTLTQTARRAGIEAGRSQIRRILLAEKVRWRRTRTWATSTDPEFAPKGPRVVELYTASPQGSRVICADEPGPVIPRTFPPALGWPPGGHRIKAPLEYSRGPDKTWVYGGLRVADGKAITMCAPSRDSGHSQRFLQQAEDAKPRGQVVIITDNLSSHDSKSTRAWPEDHPRIRHAFIPKGACWLNLQEGWWRIFRKTALAGQTFADPDEIAHATQVATPAQRPRPALDLGTTPAGVLFLTHSSRA